MVLRGEAGIGKTRLARKFLTWAGAQGAELLQGSAFESGSHLPFQPLVEALRLRLEHENSPKDLLDEDWLSPLSQLLPELRQRDPGFIPSALWSAPYQEAGSKPGAALRTLAQLTLALAKRAPLVLFVDDLQWADSATLDLLQYAIRRWRDRCAGHVVGQPAVRSFAPDDPTPASGRSAGRNGLDPMVGDVWRVSWRRFISSWSR